MSVDLKIVLGTVNYTDYLRVSAASVSAPLTEVFVDYINTPITNLAFVIPALILQTIGFGSGMLQQ
jgi:hypothetical protein